MDWVSVMIHCFSQPVLTVTELAAFWTIVKNKCLSLNITDRYILHVHVITLVAGL